ncbi:MAG TPA: hypothetical protein VHG08_03135, partial [Longimicrobium sp.]|nr:hypothetical protein [Longimicrobium sp.]
HQPRTLRAGRARSARASDRRLDQPTQHTGGRSLIMAVDCLIHLDRLRTTVDNIEYYTKYNYLDRLPDGVESYWEARVF